MAEQTKIQWCDHTLNPWRGCSHVHAGCDNCYAEALGKRFPQTLGAWGDNGTRVVAAESYWKLPEKWNRQAEQVGVRRKVFCASLADVFEDWCGPMLDNRGRELFVDGDEWFAPGKDFFAMSPGVTMHDVRYRLFSVIDATPHLDWLLVTKRPENIRRMWPLLFPNGAETHGCPHCLGAGCSGCHDGETAHRPNVWLLTSVSDQATADKMIPDLLQCRDLSPVLGISAEPLLSEIDLSRWLQFQGPSWRFTKDGIGYPPLGWVIIGCESGPNRRPTPDGAIESIVDQCAAAGVACFVKQIEVHGKVTGDIDQFPQRLQVRQYPEVK